MAVITLLIVNVVDLRQSEMWCWWLQSFLVYKCGFFFQFRCLIFIVSFEVLQVYSPGVISDVKAFIRMIGFKVFWSFSHQILLIFSVEALLSAVISH